MKAIGLFGFYGKNNFGDEIMQKELCNIIHIENKMHYQINPYVHIPKLDAFVVGGGGIITPHFPLFLHEEFFQTKKPVLFLNVNLTNECVHTGLLNKIYTHLPESFWVVRDVESLQLLEKTGFKNIRFAPDIAFLYFNRINYKGLCPSKRTINVSCNYYAFHKFFSSHIREHQQVYRVYDELCTYIKWLSDFNWETRITPIQISSDVDDNITNGVLKGFLNHRKISYTPSNNDIIYNLNICSGIISTRYHTTIYALANKLPLVDITHHSKNNNLLKDNYIEECSVNFYNITQEKLIQALYYSEHSTQYKNACRNISDEAIREWKIIISEIHNILLS